MERGKSNRLEQIFDGSGREGCREPVIGSALARLSESSDSKSPRERDAR